MHEEIQYCLLPNLCSAQKTIFLKKVQSPHKIILKQAQILSFLTDYGHGLYFNIIIISQNAK